MPSVIWWSVGLTLLVSGALAQDQPSADPAIPESQVPEVPAAEVPDAPPLTDPLLTDAPTVEMSPTWEEADLPPDAPMLRPSDAERLATFDAAAGGAVLQALAGGSRGDVDALQDIMAGSPVAPIMTRLAGDWTCRTLKLGGDLNDLVAYAPFACRIRQAGAAFAFDKLTGSQRLTGRIDMIDGRMILTGTGFVDGTDAIPYADLPDDFASDGTVWPVVGRVEQPAPDRVRILMPWPALESQFDILDLRRADDGSAPS